MLSLFLLLCLLILTESFYSVYNLLNRNRLNKNCFYNYNNRNDLYLKKERIIIMNAIKYEDISKEDINKDDDDIEEQLAKELYDELKGNSAYLTPEQFLSWQDIQDVIEDGILDTDLLAAILNEVGIKVNDKKHNKITFEKVELLLLLSLLLLLLYL